MSEGTAIAGILFGCIAIVFGATIKTFYVAKGMFGAMLTDRRIATWKGRLFFIISGIIMLLLGIQYFVLHS
jgi:hypothetical protein